MCADLSRLRRIVGCGLGFGGSVIGFERVRVGASVLSPVFSAEAVLPHVLFPLVSAASLCVTFFRSGQDEVRSAVSIGVAARQDELRGAKRVLHRVHNDFKVDASVHIFCGVDAHSCSWQNSNAHLFPCCAQC